MAPGLKSTVVVVPTCREEAIEEFMQAWQFELADCSIIVVEDNAKKTFDIKADRHYCWEDIEAVLKQDAWIIPRQTDCVRSFGFLMAARQGAKVIITLDDDCRPTQEPNFAQRHETMLGDTQRELAWENTIRGTKARGVPFLNCSREPTVYLNHGLWTGVLDVDAIGSLTSQMAKKLGSGTMASDINEPWPESDGLISRGQYFPMCGMNLAFDVALLPAMYFLLMGPKYPFDRFGDIWCGIFMKKICDHLGYGVHSGQPHVRHDRMSDVWANLRKEVPGYQVNELLWEIIDDRVLVNTTVVQCYQEIAVRLGEIQIASFNDYFKKLSEAMIVWTMLTDKK